MKNLNKNNSSSNRMISGGKSALLLSLLFVAGMLFSQESFSQQKPAASLSANGILQLPTDVPLAPAYVISLSSFGFTSESQAWQFFSGFSYDSIFIRPTFSSNRAVIMLDLAKHPGWTITNWNNLLNAQTNATPLLN